MGQQVTYGEFLLSHPHFWAFLAGGSLGAAIASATRIARGRNLRRAISRKWTAAFLRATVAVGSVAGGFLVPEGLAFLSLSSLYVGVGSLAFFCLALRFPRAGGIPAFVVLAAVAFLSPLIVRPFVPARDSAPIAEIRLLAVNPTGASLEIADLRPGADGAPEVASVAGPTVVVRARRLRISDYLFFLGARTAFVLEAVESQPDGEAAEPVSSAETRVPAGPPYARMPFVEPVVDLLPLLTLDRVESDPVSLDLLRAYSVAGSVSGRLTVERMSRTE